MDNLLNYIGHEDEKYISGYTCKTIKSGKMLEVEIYPRYKKGASKNYKKNVEAQKRLNKKNRKKKLVRLIQANFGKKDMWITVGYKNGEEPDSYEIVKKDVVNYLRRINRVHQKETGEKLKYIYVIERSKKGRFHVHIIMNFQDRDLAEKKWNKGEYPQARRLSPDNDLHLEGLAGYISKDIKNNDDGGKGKNYGYSLNLYKSWEHATVSENKVKRKHVKEIVRGEQVEREYFENLYPQYRFINLDIVSPDVVPGHYLYAKMKMRE